jgi:AcrR family transcriptional regulator
VQVIFKGLHLPRIADVHLSDRILDAAYEVVKKEGIDAVTLRAVAVRARTTTPTVYARFKTKDDLLLALSQRLRLEFAGRLMQQPTLQKAAEFYLKEAVDTPDDYKLIYEIGWPKSFMKESDQPGVIWTRERFAELYGGSPKDYALVVQCLWMELHGAASFISRAPNVEISKRLFRDCLRSCGIIISNARQFANHA